MSFHFLSWIIFLRLVLDGIFLKLTSNGSYLQASTARKYKASSKRGIVDTSLADTIGPEVVRL